ncbi:hypothetical protein LXL04_020097 [Taraxacum kok-saghyz]
MCAIRTFFIMILMKVYTLPMFSIVLNRLTTELRIKHLMLSSKKYLTVCELQLMYNLQCIKYKGRNGLPVPPIINHNQGNRYHQSRLPNCCPENNRGSDGESSASPIKRFIGDRVFLFTSPVLSELGGGRWSAIVSGSNAGGPFLRLLIGQNDLGRSSRRLNRTGFLIDGCGCAGKWYRQLVSVYRHDSPPIVPETVV